MSESDKICYRSIAAARARMVLDGSITGRSECGKWVIVKYEDREPIKLTAEEYETVCAMLELDIKSKHVIDLSSSSSAALEGIDAVTDKSGKKIKGGDKKRKSNRKKIHDDQMKLF